MLPSVKRIHIEHAGIVVFGAAILACPNLASSSSFAPPHFGLTQTVQMAITVSAVFLLRVLPQEPSDERRARHLWGILLVFFGALLALEGFCATQRSNDAWIRSSHGDLPLCEQALLIVAMLAWMLCARRCIVAGEGAQGERDREQPSLVIASGFASGFLLMILFTCVPAYWNAAHDGMYLLIGFMLALGAESFLTVAVLMYDMRILLASFCGRMVWLALPRAIPSSLDISLAPSFVLGCAVLAAGAFVGLCLCLVRLARRRGAQQTKPRDEYPSNPYVASLEQLDGYGKLSAREAEAVRMALEGLTQKQTAHHLGISAPTAGTYRMRAYGKLGVASKGELIELVESSGSGGWHEGLLPESVLNGGQSPESLDIDIKRALIPVLASMSAYGAAVALSMLLPGESRVLIAQLAGSIGLLLALHYSAEDILDSSWNRTRTRRAAIMLFISLALLSTPFLCSPYAVFDMNQMKAALRATMALGVCATATLLLIDMRFVELSLRRNMSRYCVDESRAHHYLVSKGIEPFVADILLGVARGKTTRSLAKLYCLSPSTIAAYRSHGYKVLGVSGRKELRECLRAHGASCK